MSLRTERTFTLTDDFSSIHPFEDYITHKTVALGTYEAKSDVENSTLATTLNVGSSRKHNEE